jgi:hypothetical protein
LSELTVQVDPESLARLGREAGIVVQIGRLCSTRIPERIHVLIGGIRTLDGKKLAVDAKKGRCLDAEDHIRGFIVCRGTQNLIQ